MKPSDTSHWRVVTLLTAFECVRPAQIDGVRVREDCGVVHRSRPVAEKHAAHLNRANEVARAR